MKTEKLNQEISVIVENYTKEQIINALNRFSESYYGARSFLENQPIEKLAELLIDLADETDFTAMDLLDAETMGF